tara:strand:- start:593 stop:1201 length:609 start_codon:yes stop_codon:yes gene_type:complete
MNALSVLNSEDQKVYDNLLDECRDSWRKRQVFRTETEMRLSVLNEGKHPTAASKYWQAVREQSVFFDNVMALSFEYRRNVIKLAQKEKELAEEKDGLECDLLLIDIDELKWIIGTQKQESHHRIRELEHWSRIKSELDDGTFDTVDPNTHQQVSLPKRFEQDMKALTPGTSASEARNIIGLHATAVNSQYLLKNGKSDGLLK